MKTGRIVKVKFIGSKDTAKPFWAYASDVDKATELCAKFMHAFIFGAEHDSYEEIFNLVKHARFIEAYQAECGSAGITVKTVFPVGKKHYSFNGKRRIYNHELYQYLAKGYLQVPKIKLTRCAIEDKSGIHCKGINDIAMILMRDIICPYFANTIRWAEEHDRFEITLYMRSTDSEKEFIDPRNILLIMFAAWLEYCDYLSGMTSLSSKVLETMRRFSKVFSVLTPYMPPVPVSAVADNFGSYSISYTSEGPKENVFTYSRITSRTHGDDLPISEDIPLHLFDDISEFTKHCINQGEHARTCHVSITVNDRFWPKSLVERIQTL